MSSTMKTILSLIVIAAIVVAIVLFGGSDKENTNISSEESSEVVAIAGEEEITAGELQRAVTIYRQNPQTQQVSEEQVLAQLINQKLLYQKAVKSGVTIKKSEIDAAYDQVVANFGSEESLEAELGFSSDEFKEFLEEQLVTQAYVDSLREDFDAEISDAEIQAAFEEFAAQAEGEVTLEEVQDSLVAFLEEQAFQEQLAQEIIDLQDQYPVEIIEEGASVESEAEMEAETEDMTEVEASTESETSAEEDMSASQDDSEEEIAE